LSFSTTDREQQRIEVKIPSSPPPPYPYATSRVTPTSPVSPLSTTSQEHMHISKFRHMRQLNAQPTAGVDYYATHSTRISDTTGGSIDHVSPGYRPGRGRVMSREMSLGVSSVAGHEHEYRGGVRSSKSYTDYLFRTLPAARGRPDGWTTVTETTTITSYAKHSEGDRWVSVRSVLKAKFKKLAGARSN